MVLSREVLQPSAPSLCAAHRLSWWFFFFQAEDGIRDLTVTGVQTCALPIFLAGDQIGGAQRFDRARAGVAQVADRRGDDIEASWDHPVNGGSRSFVKPAMNWAGAPGQNLFAGLLRAAGFRLIRGDMPLRLGE